MSGVSRRDFVKGAAASAALLRTGSAWANPLGLPLALQLYSVREFLPKDYDGTLRQLGAMGYREVRGGGVLWPLGCGREAGHDAGGTALRERALYAADPAVSRRNSQVRGRTGAWSYIICSSPMVRDPSRAKGLSWVAGLEGDDGGRLEVECRRTEPDRGAGARGGDAVWLPQPLHRVSRTRRIPAVRCAAAGDGSRSW